MTMSSEDAALEALLSEALDDFDAPPPASPAKTSNAAKIESIQANAASSVVGNHATDKDAAAVRPMPATTNTSDAGAAATAQVSPEDELAKLLIEELRLGANSDGSDAAALAAAASAAASAAAVDLSEEGSKGDGGDMDKTLRALASSAEALADDRKGSNSNDEEAMLELLRQLGGSVDGAENGNPNDAAEAGMIELLQKLSAELPAELTNLGAGIPAGSGATTAAPKPTSGDADGSSRAAHSAGSGSGSGGKAKASASSASASSTSAEGAPHGKPDEDTAMEGLLDNLVGQLLSKDVMYEPMKHLHEEFPVRMRRRFCPPMRLLLPPFHVLFVP